MLGDSHFFVRMVGSNFWGKFSESPWIFLNKISHSKNCPSFRILKKIQSGGFQGQQVSQNFEPADFQRWFSQVSFHKSKVFFIFYLFWVFFSFLYFPFIFFWVCFLFLFLKWKREIMKQTPIFFQ
jgi:hypothetical protein